MKSIFIFILCLMSSNKLLSMGAPRPVDCLDDRAKERIVDSFSTYIEKHITHGRALAVYLIDSNGKALSQNAIEVDANHKRPVASVQKILSSFIAFDNRSKLGSSMLYSSNAELMDEASDRPPSEGYVHNDNNDVANPGDKISFNKTLTELLARSANGAGYMIAENLYMKDNQGSNSISKVESYYAEKAMSYAREILGLKMTSIFENPHGLDVYAGQTHFNHGSTAAEMAKLLAGLAVKKSNGKRFDEYLWSLGGGIPFRKGRIYKNGSTTRAGKTFIALEDVSSGSCKGKRVSLSIFGDGDFSGISKLYSNILSELYK